MLVNFWLSRKGSNVCPVLCFSFNIAYLVISASESSLFFSPSRHGSPTFYKFCTLPPPTLLQRFGILYNCPTRSNNHYTLPFLYIQKKKTKWNLLFVTSYRGNVKGSIILAIFTKYVFFLLLSPIVRDIPNPSPSEIVFERVVFTDDNTMDSFLLLIWSEYNLYNEKCLQVTPFCCTWQADAAFIPWVSTWMSLNSCWMIPIKFQESKLTFE